MRKGEEMTLDDIAIGIIVGIVFMMFIQAFLMQFGECEGWFFDKKNWKRGDKNNNKRATN